MEEYKKVVYVWNEPQARITVPSRLHFRSLDNDALNSLVTMVSAVMADSMDRGDHHEAAKQGADEAAKQFIAQAEVYFSYKLSWWQLAYDSHDEAVGFVLPVIFPNCAKDGLEEGTIYYIGVLPEQRGQGYAYDLLCQCTHILQEVGVWRIYCDTDVYNTPMIATFQKAGYVQEGEPKVVELS